MGAVYRAVDLGQGFTVGKFHIREAVLFPVEVGGVLVEYGGLGGFY